MAIKIAGIEVSVPAFAELLHSNADFAELLYSNADFADITQLGVSKDQFIKELVPLIDDLALVSTKGVSDTLSIVDYDLLTYSFAKKLRDTSIADDLHIIDVTKVLQDTYSVQEYLYKDLAKTSADNVTTTELPLISVSKPVYDENVLMDNSNWVVQKNLDETAYVYDHVSITFSARANAMFNVALFNQSTFG